MNCVNCNDYLLGGFDNTFCQTCLKEDYKRNLVCVMCNKGCILIIKPDSHIGYYACTSKGCRIYGVMRKTTVVKRLINK